MSIHSPLSGFINAKKLDVTKLDVVTLSLYYANDKEVEEIVASFCVFLSDNSKSGLELPTLRNGLVDRLLMRHPWAISYNGISQPERRLMEVVGDIFKKDPSNKDKRGLLFEFINYCELSFPNTAIRNEFKQIIINTIRNMYSDDEIKLKKEPKVRVSDWYEESWYENVFLSSLQKELKGCRVYDKYYNSVRSHFLVDWYGYTIEFPLVGVIDKPDPVEHIKNAFNDLFVGLLKEALEIVEKTKTSMCGIKKLQEDAERNLEEASALEKKYRTALRDLIINNPKGD